MNKKDIKKAQEKKASWRFQSPHCWDPVWIILPTSGEMLHDAWFCWLKFAVLRLNSPMFCWESPKVWLNTPLSFTEFGRFQSILLMLKSCSNSFLMLKSPLFRARRRRLPRRRPSHLRIPQLGFSDRENPWISQHTSRFYPHHKIGIPAICFGIDKNLRYCWPTTHSEESRKMMI